MNVRCWGARGSIPVSGAEYLQYGGDTTCLEIRTQEDETIIIDAGSGMRRLGTRLLAEKRHHYSLLLTHAHWDHIMGFPYFKPIYREGTTISLFGCPFVQTSVKQMISRIMDSPNFPVNFDDIKTAITYHESCDAFFALHSLEVATVPLSHPNQGVGYKIAEQGKSFIFLTDNELDYKHAGGLDYNDYVNFSSHADLLIHDAEYLESDYGHMKTWGHSIYKRALQLAIDAKVKKFGLFHHNQDRSDDAINGMVADCCRIIQEQQAILECFAVYQDMEIVV